MPPVGAVDLATADATIRAALPGAAAISLRHFRTEVVTDNKLGDLGYDPVTEADRGVEVLLREAIGAQFPEHRIVGEEHGTTGPADASAWWIIDPIDGTRAFVSGMPAWGTLIGLVVDGRAVAGWMHQPYIGELFSGIDGAGWLERGEERRSLRVRATTDLTAATMYSTHPSMFTTSDEQAAFERISSKVRMYRFGGDCYSYGLLAIGCVDLVVESSMQPYDIVPLIPIIEAAGGVVTDRDGALPLAGGFIVAAATPELHAAALALVNQENVS
jgi:myo-inositol-1(or 4)-monophosphatase